MKTRQGLVALAILALLTAWLLSGPEDRGRSSESEGSLVSVTSVGEGAVFRTESLEVLPKGTNDTVAQAWRVRPVSRDSRRVLSAHSYWASNAGIVLPVLAPDADAAGVFKVVRWPERAGYLVIEAVGHYAARISRPTDPGVDVVDIELDPLEAIEISGEIVWESGERVADARVEVSPLSWGVDRWIEFLERQAGPGTRDLAVRSDSSGRYQVSGAPADAHLAVVARSSGSVSFPARVVVAPAAAGRKIRDVRLVLRRGVSMDFHVVDSRTGIPVERVGVSGVGVRRGPLQKGVLGGVTDRDGVVRVMAPEVGRYPLSFSGPSAEYEILSRSFWTTSKTQVIHLRRRLKVDIELRDRSGAFSCADTRFRVSDGTQHFGLGVDVSVPVRNRVRFTVKSLSSAEQEVIEGRCGEGWMGEHNSRCTLSVGLDDPLKVTALLAGVEIGNCVVEQGDLGVIYVSDSDYCPGSIAMGFSAADGTPYTNALTVYLEDSGSLDLLSASRVTVSPNESGRIVLAGLTAGTYTVAAATRDRGWFSRPFTCKVPARGEAVAPWVNVADPASITIETRTADGRLVEYEASIWSYLIEGYVPVGLEGVFPAIVTTGVSGVSRVVSPILPGPCRLELRAEGYAPVLMDLDLEEGKEGLALAVFGEDDRSVMLRVESGAGYSFASFIVIDLARNVRVSHRVRPFGGSENVLEEEFLLRPEAYRVVVEWSAVGGRSVSRELGLVVPDDRQLLFPLPATSR